MKMGVLFKAVGHAMAPKFQILGSLNPCAMLSISIIYLQAVVGENGFGEFFGHCGIARKYSELFVFQKNIDLKEKIVFLGSCVKNLNFTPISVLRAGF